MKDRNTRNLLLATLISLPMSSVPSARAQSYTALSTYLNVYFNDSAASSTVAPGKGNTKSPYFPTLETVPSSSTGIGLPLANYGAGSWLEGFGTSWPGFTTATFNPLPFVSSGKATGQVSYDQGSFFMGSNTVSSTTVSPYGTSLSLTHTGSGIAELRLDWTTSYLYTGPVNTWSATTPYNFGDMITDGNGNAQLCIAAGTSGPGSPGPTWAVPGGANPDTTDGGVTWLLLPAYVPQGLLVTINGTVPTGGANFIALTGEEMFSLNGVTATVALPWGGDFLGGFSTLPPALSTSFLDTGVLGVFGTRTAGSFFETVGAYPTSGSTPMLIQDGDLVTVSGYLDLFVDPATVALEIAPVVPPTLGMANTAMGPAVYFPMLTPTNHILQMSTNLALGNWTTVTNGIPTTVTDQSGEIFGALVMTNKGGNAFFRLH